MVRGRWGSVTIGRRALGVATEQDDPQADQQHGPQHVRVPQPELPGEQDHPQSEQGDPHPGRCVGKSADQSLCRGVGEVLSRDQPPQQEVDQDPDPGEEREHHEYQAEYQRAHSRVVGQAAGHAGDQPMAGPASKRSPAGRLLGWLLHGCTRRRTRVCALSLVHRGHHVRQTGAFHPGCPWDDPDVLAACSGFSPIPAPPRPVSVAPGATLVNPQTGQAIFTAPGRAQNQKPPTLQEAEADRAAEEGSPEQIATDSTEARREEIMAKMPAKYRQILQQGFYEEDVPAVDADGNPIPGKIERRKSQPDANEAEAAQRMFDREYDRLYKQNLSYTQGVARQKAAQRRTQARSQGASTGPSGPRAKLSDVKKLLTPQR